jgi:hypothetical protein
MKRGETFGCRNTGQPMYQIAPGTAVWLGNKRIKEEMKRNGDN